MMNMPRNELLKSLTKAIVQYLEARRLVVSEPYDDSLEQRSLIQRKLACISTIISYRW